jgi:apolipoprotein D and lipocalin family protein
MWTRLVVACGVVVWAGGCASTYSERRGLEPPQTVESVDLGRYMGTWYEIASFPNRFQENCTGTRATYELRDDGTVRVVNRCFADELEGEEMVVEGTAHAVADSGNAKLRVTFFWPFYGDYWIVALDPGYQWVAVSEAGRKYAWILARTPELDHATYEAILTELRAKQIPVHFLRKTLQR